MKRIRQALQRLDNWADFHEWTLVYFVLNAYRLHGEMGFIYPGMFSFAWNLARLQSFNRLTGRRK